MKRRVILGVIACAALASQFACARTVADVSTEELAGWVRAASPQQVSTVMVVSYATCLPDLTGERWLDVVLPLTLTYLPDMSGVQPNVSGEVLNLTAPRMSVAATFPEDASDEGSEAGKMNLAEAKLLMASLSRQFESLADYYEAQPPDYTTTQSIRQSIVDGVSAAVSSEVDEVPDIVIADIDFGDETDMPELSLCPGTAVAARATTIDDIPRSDGARGAFLFSTSEVKPRSVEYLKDGDGNVIAYRPIQQDAAVDVVSLSVRGEDDAEVLADGRGSKIIGGNPVTAGEMDWSVAFTNIKADGKMGNFCGGTVISDRWIVTAAHCRVTPRSTVVLIRKDINGEGGHEREVKTVWRHIDFGKAANYDADIALVELADDADAPIIDLHASPLGVDEVVRVVGWGAQVVGGGSVETMHEVDLKTVRNSTCQDFYRVETNKVTLNMVCALEQDADACQGDSGSGLFYATSSDTYELAGIVSFGKGCANRLYPGVYTAIDAYRAWIEKVQVATEVSGEL